MVPHSIFAAHSAWETPFSVGCGLIVAVGGNLVVQVLLSKVRKNARLRPPNGVGSASWEAAIETDTTGTELLGYLEAVFFFVAFWLSAYALAAGWLVFKLGSKWAVWQHIIKVPESLRREGEDVLDYLGARNQWGSWLLQALLVGTLGNILAGAVGVGVVHVLR